MNNSASDVVSPSGGGSEKIASAGASPVAPVTGWRAAWAHWMKMGHAIGVVQTRILMVIFYFVMVMPLGLVLRWRGDPLHLKPRASGNWTPHQQQEQSLDAVRRQF